MKGYSTFPTALISRITIRLFSVISRTLVAVGSCSSAEIQFVYPTAPADWAEFLENSPYGN